MAVVWFWTAIILLLVTFWKKRSRPFEAVPGGTRKQTGLPCETLLDRGPLLSVPQGQMASPLDEGRTPRIYSGECQNITSLCTQDEHTKGRYPMNRFVKGMLLGIGIVLLVAPMRGEEIRKK